MRIRLKQPTLLTPELTQTLELTQMLEQTQGTGDNRDEHNLWQTSMLPLSSSFGRSDYLLLTSCAFTFMLLDSPPVLLLFHFFYGSVFIACWIELTS
jgi:hypothetical protein